MTDLVLVRHAETVWHAENRYAGRTDVALNARGAQQARRFAEWAVANGPFDTLRCSPLSRCRRTAEPAATALGLEVHLEPRLRELDFGRGEGLTRQEMRDAFPEAVAAFHRDPAKSPLPGGEDPYAATARGMRALGELVDSSASAGGRLLVVTHNTLLRLMLCHMVGLGLSEYRRVFPVLDNVSPVAVRHARGQWSLLRYNVPLPP